MRNVGSERAERGEFTADLPYRLGMNPNGSQAEEAGGNEMRWKRGAGTGGEDEEVCARGV
jgi:hypothetical protein